LATGELAYICNYLGWLEIKYRDNNSYKQLIIEVSGLTIQANAYVYPSFSYFNYISDIVRSYCCGNCQ